MSDQPKADHLRMTHFDAQGQAHMVDVSNKAHTLRVATAVGRICMQPQTLTIIASNQTSKGDVLGVARIAAIQATKKTAELIPLCHPLTLSKVSVAFDLLYDPVAVQCCVTVQTTGQTGAEMEAMTGVAVALLTVYDMCKAVDRGMVVSQLGLLEKSGGKSGHWLNETLG